MDRVCTLVCEDKNVKYVNSRTAFTNSLHMFAERKGGRERKRGKRERETKRRKRREKKRETIFYLSFYLSFNPFKKCHPTRLLKKKSVSSMQIM